MSMSRESKKDSFLLYLSHKKLFARHDDKGRSELIMGLFMYVEDGAELKSTNPAVEMAFTAIQDDLDRNAERYSQQCGRNRENGKLGGRPKGKPKEPSGFLGNPYDYVTDNGNEYDI